MKRLENKISLVTGASSGIGAAIAKEFALEGSYVILVGRNEERGLKVLSEIKADGGDGEWRSCDLSMEKQVKELGKYVEDSRGKLDILVNNAGIWKVYDLPSIDREKFDRVYAANVDSVMEMTKYFMPLLEKTKGNIVNVASIGGLQSNIAGRSQYLYASSKAAVIQFSQLCALNYAKSVRVNCICPGPTDTPIYTNRDFSRFHDSIPMGRIGRPEDVAKAAVFLASDDASYITGAILTVDGGASLV